MHPRTFFAFLAFFISCVLVISGLAILFVMAFHGELLVLALFLFLPIGLVTAWVTVRSVRAPIVYVCSAVCAVTFLVLVPRAIALHIIEASAKAVSGGRYCVLQAEVPTGSLPDRTILTSDVSDLSFLSMLQRGSRRFGPPHVVLITREQTWLWSFRGRAFVPWQRIDRVGSSFALEGSEFIGRPSVEQVSSCLRLIEH
jgi:hypothetical protein